MLEVDSDPLERMGDVPEVLVIHLRLKLRIIRAIVVTTNVFVVVAVVIILVLLINTLCTLVDVAHDLLDAGIVVFGALQHVTIELAGFESVVEFDWISKGVILVVQLEVLPVSCHEKFDVLRVLTVCKSVVILSCGGKKTDVLRFGEYAAFEGLGCL